MTKFEHFKVVMGDAADFLNKRYGAGTVLVIKDSYYNMKEMIEPHPKILEYAKEAYRAIGVEPRFVPVRVGRMDRGCLI